MAIPRTEPGYEVALILRSICPTRVSRSLFRFSYSRTFFSSAAESRSILSETSPTVNSS